MRLSAEQQVSVRNWMYRNARPLDIARWKYHFEYGSRQEVLDALAAYQNKNGGFGNALEADSWNPKSSPIQTWCATEILYEIGINDKNNKIIQGILEYLNSGKNFNNGYWYAEIPTNDDYPHAPWWSYGDNVVSEWGYNPTICLVGFILNFADRHFVLYDHAIEIAKKAINTFMQGELIKDMHEAKCFIRFYEYCKKANITGLYEENSFRSRLIEMVKGLITENKEEWKTGYVCRPSQFMFSPDSIFYDNNKNIAGYEVEYIIETLSSEGSWEVNWNWGAYEKEWAISKNWWKANQTIINMMYLTGFDAIDKQNLFVGL